MWGSIVGGAVSGLLGGLGSAASNAMQWAYSKEAAKLQFEHQKQLNIQSNELSKDYTKWLNTEGHSQLREGLEKAGYNPMLAVNASPSSGSISGGSAGMPNVPNSDIGASAVNAYKVFNLERQKIKADTNATNASASLLSEQKKTETYKQKQIEADTALKYVDKLLGDKQLSWYDKKQLMEIKTGYMNAQANHLASEAAQLNAHTAQANYRMNKGITDYENVNRKALADFLEKHPKIKGAGLFLDTLGLRLNNLFRK